MKKESGEACIQFWFRVARSGRSQSDCRTELHHGHVLNKDCNSDLKEPREGQLPVIQQAIDEATYRLSLAKCT